MMVEGVLSQSLFIFFFTKWMEAIHKTLQNSHFDFCEFMVFMIHQIINFHFYPPLKYTGANIWHSSSDTIWDACIPHYSAWIHVLVSNPSSLLMCTPGDSIWWLQWWVPATTPGLSSRLLALTYSSASYCRHWGVNQIFVSVFSFQIHKNNFKKNLHKAKPNRGWNKFSIIHQLEFFCFWQWPKLYK